MEKEKTTALDIALGVAGGVTMVLVGVPLAMMGLSAGVDFLDKKLSPKRKVEKHQQESHPSPDQPEQESFSDQETYPNDVQNETY